MALMPQHTDSNGREFPPADTGEYRVRLRNIAIKDRKDPKGETYKVYRLTLETLENQLDPNGNAFYFNRDVSVRWSDKGKLAPLMDGIFGRRLSKAEFESQDLECLLGEVFIVYVELMFGPDGKPFNRIVTGPYRPRGHYLPFPISGYTQWWREESERRTRQANERERTSNPSGYQQQYAPQETDDFGL